MLLLLRCCRVLCSTSVSVSIIIGLSLEADVSAAVLSSNVFHSGRTDSQGMFDLGCLGGAEEGHSYKVTSASSRSSALTRVLYCFHEEAAVDSPSVVGEAGPCRLLGGSLEVKHWPAVTLSAVVGGRLHHRSQIWSPDRTFQLCCFR